MQGEEADRAAWVIGPDGVWAEGAAAVNRVWRDMGGGWSVLARAYRLWLLAAVEEAGYRWFARNRSSFHRFGVSPECDEPGSGCEDLRVGGGGSRREFFSGFPLGVGPVHGPGDQGPGGERLRGSAQGGAASR